MAHFNDENRNVKTPDFQIATARSVNSIKINSIVQMSTKMVPKLCAEVPNSKHLFQANAPQGAITV
jgi:hypothetical protein